MCHQPIGCSDSCIYSKFMTSYSLCNAPAFALHQEFVQGISHYCAHITPHCLCKNLCPYWCPYKINLPHICYSDCCSVFVCVSTYFCPWRFWGFLRAEFAGAPACRPRVHRFPSCLLTHWKPRKHCQLTGNRHSSLFFIAATSGHDLSS